MSGLIVHEWLAQHGGSENVVQVLAEHFHDANVLALWEDPPSRFAPGRVRETRLARTPLRGRKALALPAMPTTWRHEPLGEPEWMLVSSHAFAHQVATNPGAPDRTSVYVHTPARYIWAPEHDARDPNPVLAPARAALRTIDRRRASNTARFAANSAFVADRVARAWGQEATVIHPPVAVEELQVVADWSERVSAADAETLESRPPTYVLGASRFVAYKRVDLAIRVGELLDLPVVLAGAGAELEMLRERARAATVPVQIVEAPSNALLRALMQGASLYVFPPIEDFGIMPIEAAALDTPSLVNVIGGAGEGIHRVGVGEAVDFEDESSVLAAGRRVLDSVPGEAATGAEFFGHERFIKQIEGWRA